VARRAADHVRLFNEPIAGDAPPDVDDPYGWDEGVFKLAARVIDRAMHAWARGPRRALARVTIPAPRRRVLA
jgi:hypothetical protein